jgi:6,7-dimethyl-8-ribityllumazine synthase
MATENKNLSQVDLSQFKFMLTKKIAIIQSEWNDEITGALTEGAKNTLVQAGVKANNVKVYKVPGSFELPLGAKLILDKEEDLDAVICVGCIIRGETSHFDFVAQGVTYGVQKLNLQYGKPVVFCVLTDNTIEQSRARSGGSHGNKGVEAAATALKMIQLKDNLK